jgi:hypothetical protein
MTSSSENADRSMPQTRRNLFVGIGFGLAATPIASRAAQAQAKHPPDEKKAAAEPTDGEKPRELSPEEKMARRFPQPVRISYLIGLPMIDEGNETLGHVQRVVRSAAGKIRLVIAYGGLFGIGSRLIAVPVEVCAMLGRQVAAADMPRDAFEPAPTWYGAGDEMLGGDEVIRVAVMRR